jgi:hypothetical protein
VANPTGTSIFDLDFELDADEVRDFESSVGSRLNGVLPIRLAFGVDGYTFAVRKQRHSKALTAKRAEIEEFVAGHVSFQYIPASRTSRAALDVVEDMVAKELAAVARTPEYEAALETITRLEEPVVKALENALCTSMQEILPGVRTVELEVRRDVRPIGQSVEVYVDDGNRTTLEFKGDGMQSLAALSLIRHVSEETARGRALILAVEEPEAHLHPGAIHDIATVLRETSQSQQIVISTHSPLLVNRVSVGSNLIVEETKARAARSLEEVRQALGVRTSDNLQHADLILVVEGPEDERALRALLASRSPRLRAALANGVFGFRPLFGGAKLPYVLSEIQGQVFQSVVFLDNDAAGRESAKKARDEGFLDVADEVFAQFPGARESEFEDLINVATYEGNLAAALGVNMAQFPAIARNRGKWSSRMKLLCENQGKRWDDQVEGIAKRVVSEAVAASPAAAVDPRCVGVMDLLATTLESRLA